MKKSVSTSLTPFSKAESPAGSLGRSFSAVGITKSPTAKVATSQPLTPLQAFSLASTPVILTPQQEYRTQGGWVPAGSVWSYRVLP